MKKKNESQQLGPQGADACKSQQQPEVASQKGCSCGTEVAPATDIARVEMLFKSYPLTLALLRDTEGIEIGERMLTFLAGVDGYARGSGLPVGEIDAALQMLFSVVKGYLEGTFTLDALEVILKGQGYDRSLAEARKAGEAEGRKAAEEQGRKEAEEKGRKAAEEKGDKAQPKGRKAAEEDGRKSPNDTDPDASTHDGVPNLTRHRLRTDRTTLGIFSLAAGAK